MSLEQTIQEHTAALREQTVAIGLLTAAVLKVTSGATFPDSEPQPETEKKPRASRKPAAETQASTPAESSATEPPKTDAAPAVAPEPQIKESLAAESGLPAGDRDKKYYDSYIFPLFKRLAEATLPDHGPLKKITAHFGVDRVSNVPPENWDEMVILGKKALAKVEAARSVL